MRNYIIRRLVAMPLMLLVMSFVLFLLLWIKPGDAAFAVVAGIEEARNLDVWREELGLDRPWYVQYFDWLGNVFQGDLGDSLRPPRNPVADKVQERIGNTIEIGLLTIAISAIIGLPIGIISAIRRNTLSDYTLRTATIVGISVPNFWTGTLIIIFPVIWWGWNPIQPYTSFTEDPLTNLSIVIFPAAILAYGSAAYTARIVRSSMLEVFFSDYVRTARAKGLRERVVVMRHVFRTSLIPVLTVIGLQLGAILGGAVVAESIFAIPGMGLLMLESVQTEDYPVVLTVVLLFALMFMIITLAVDVLYTTVDPRIRY
ncbi:MAG: ABC transporter permease [Chloroflexi bacterium]|nr:ABC transporter permease [Chloroflexota bacterium]